MASDQTVAIWFLVYLALPVIAFFFWWLAGWVRRKILKKGGEEADAERSES